MTPELQTVLEIAGVGSTLLFLALGGLVTLMYALTSPLLYGGFTLPGGCLLYTSPSPRDGLLSRMPSSA